MKTTLRFFMLLATLFAIFSIANALTVTIGEGASQTNYLLPIDTYAEYCYTQQIYTQAQINTAGSISKIRFFRQSGGRLDYCRDWVIYMGHSTRSSFNSNTDWEPVSNLTQVFEGDVFEYFPAEGQWMEIPLDTVFEYNNVDNLVIAVDENTPGQSSTVTWGAFSSGVNSGIYNCDYSQNIDPSSPGWGGLTDTINRLQLVFPDTEVPMAPLLLFPEDGAQMMGGQSLNWALPHGSADASGFDVYIDGSIVSSNQAGMNFKISAMEPGEHTWRVVARNNIGSSAPSETRTFNLCNSIVIGNSDTINSIPVNFGYNYNYSQSIFLQSQINVSDQQIEKIAYHWNGTAVANMTNDWVVYMGYTGRNEFSNSSDWLAVGEMVQVFEGHLDLPATPAWVEIPLDTPFAYNNVENLVIAVDENTPGRDGFINYFFSTPTPSQNRSIRVCSNSFNPDPSSTVKGNLETAFPNIMLQFGELPVMPHLSLTPSVVDFGTLINQETTESLTVMVSNFGNGNLNLSEADLSIIGANADEFSFDPIYLPASLSSGQYIYIPLSVTGMTAGQIHATFRIIYNGQNHDVELTAKVWPAESVTIGDGILAQSQPFGTSYHGESTATLYSFDQINTVGYIDMLAWDCAFTSDTVVLYKIWAKNSTGITFGSEPWIRMTEDMVLIKQGVHIPNKIGWQTFQLDQPFLYGGNDLIIAVESNYGDMETSSFALFKYAIMGSNRHQFWQEDLLNFSGCGDLDDKTPNIMMHFVSEIENDIGIKGISGNLTPNVGSISNYTVQIRNNGSNDQNAYIVKLMGPDNTVLASVNGPALSSGQSTELELSWTPTVAGTISIYGKVELVNDEIDVNNRSNIINIAVHPVGTQAVTIGEGNDLAAYPIDFYYRNFISECIYMSDELGFESGAIISISLTNNFMTNIPNGATKIWMASTTQSDLSGGWTPASELTLVFDGNIHYPAGQNVITITLQTPYIHTHGNLVLRFYRPPGIPYTHLEKFLCQAVGFNRLIYIYSDLYDIDPYNPPGLMRPNSLPKITFFHNEEVLDSDLDQVSVLENTALNGNFPNPFNSQTTIRYSIKTPGTVKLQVYNIKGQLVKTLVNEEQMTGHYRVVFNSRDNKGKSIASGVYLLKLSAPGYQKTSKMILMQ